jgi:hypothetical protein
MHLFHSSVRRIKSCAPPTCLCSFSQSRRGVRHAVETEGWEQCHVLTIAPSVSRKLVMIGDVDVEGSCFSNGQLRIFAQAGVVVLDE